MKRALDIQTKLSYFDGIIIDIAVIILADFCAFRLQLGKNFLLSVNFAEYKEIVFYTIIFKLLCLYIFQLYDLPKVRTNFINLINIIKATTVSSLSMAVIAYFFRAEAIPRMVILQSWYLTILLLFAWRIIAKSILKLIFGEDFFKLPILIIGTDGPAEEMAIWLLNNGAVNYKIVGFISNNPSESREELLNYPILDSIENIERIPKRYHVEQVFVMTPNIPFKSLAKIFSAFRRKREVTFCATPGLCEEIVSTSPFAEGRFQFISSVPFQRVAVWYLPVKRISDILISIALLLVLSPLIVIVTIIIKLSSPGPAFYLTKRIGFMGREFVMFKFRSMYHLSGQRRVERWTKKQDERITPIGKFIRRVRIDELPQLVNVLKGEMSFIGPRPETKYYVSQLSKKIPLYLERLNAKPGITGWAQVNFGYAGSIEESKEKLLFDIYYIQNQSIFLDLLILLKSVKTVITGAGL